MTVRNRLGWAALAAAGALAATLALARSPSDDFGPSSGGTAPAAGDTAVEHSPYGRTITVYGTINTNDALVFMDRTGNRVRGTNLVAAAQAELYATNALTRAMIAALQAGTNNWNAAYAWGDWSGRVGALEAGTNAWNAAAALAATALQPSWAVTGTVANAQHLVSADGSLIWTEIENGTNWQYCVTNAVGVEGNRDRIVVVGFTHTDEFNPYSGPSSNAVFAGSGVPVDGVYSYRHGRYSLSWNLPIEMGMRIWLTGDTAWRSLTTTNMPATLDEDEHTGTVTIDWYGPVTNRTQIATQTGTVILISEHNERTDASIHPTLPRHSDVTNTVSAAVAAIPRVPTNAVTGWLMYDYGSNMWLRVSVSNWSFTVWEVVE